MITHETRKESNEKVDKYVRYKQVLEALDFLSVATAKDVAVYMKEKGYSNTDERNLSAPRLTELVKEDRVIVVGKTKCQHSGKTVSLFRRND